MMKWKLIAPSRLIILPIDVYIPIIQSKVALFSICRNAVIAISTLAHSMRFCFITVERNGSTEYVVVVFCVLFFFGQRAMAAYDLGRTMAEIQSAGQICDFHDIYCAI